MEFLTHPLITQEHLRCDVIVYVRQSSERQVEHNKGSTEFQRGQVDLARAYGWRQEQVIIIEDDLGRSATNVENRPGYRRMVELIGSGKVKAVIAADISRLSRNLGDLITFLALAARQRAVLILDRRPVDPRNHSDIFVSQILGNVAEYDNRIRTDTMVRARIAKAKNGEIVIPLPIGYTKLNDGTVVMNPEVKDSIELIIQTFREEKSLLGTVRSLRKRNIKLPTKRRKGRVDWIDATTIRVGGILMNPAYAGTFAYGRSEHNPDSKRPTKRPPRRPVPEDRWIKTYNRLPAYITVEEQQKFRQIVTGNRFSNRHRIGRGSALLQGLLVCSICGAKLIVSYYGGK